MVRTASPGSKRRTVRPHPISYCAYSTCRSYAARHRNRSNCHACKQDHTKCNVSDGIACDRCKRLKKHCSLSDPTNSGTGRSTSRSPPINEDEQQFGQILYIMLCDRKDNFEVIHVRVAADGHDQVYRSRVDQNMTAVGAPEYIGPLIDFLNRFAIGAAMVDVQDLLNVPRAPQG